LLVATAVLAAPGFASASHVGSTAYDGAVTTGQGGVHLNVGPYDDGLGGGFPEDTLTYSVSNLGNTAGTCTGVNFGGGPVPIQNHSFTASFDGINGGDYTISGTFGPSSVTGTAEHTSDDLFPCDTGPQEWTAAGPDAYFARPPSRGQHVYNPTGAGQIERDSVGRGGDTGYGLRIGNDGPSASYRVKGCHSSRGFKVAYRDDSGDVTAAVRSGTYETDELPYLDPGQKLTLEIKVLNTATPGKTKTCKVTASSDLFVDTVKAEVKARR
jgi:hypothetical protein